MINPLARVRWNALGPAGRVRKPYWTDPRGSNCLICASPHPPAGAITHGCAVNVRFPRRAAHLSRCNPWVPT